MEVKTLTIQGMSCQHCVMHVKKELSKIASVKDVKIGSAVVEIDPGSGQALAIQRISLASPAA